jgi:hypothetical protein
LTRIKVLGENLFHLRLKNKTIWELLRILCFKWNTVVMLWPIISLVMSRINWLLARCREVGHVLIKPMKWIFFFKCPISNHLNSRVAPILLHNIKAISHMKSYCAKWMSRFSTSCIINSLYQKKGILEKVLP